MNQTAETQKKIEFDNLDFLHVRLNTSFNPDVLEKYDAVIIEYTSDHKVLETINDIHAHNDRNIYITPVFLLSSAGNMDDTIVALADGIIANLTNLDSAAAATRKILSRL